MILFIIPMKIYIKSMELREKNMYSFSIYNSILSDAPVKMIHCQTRQKTENDKTSCDIFTASKRNLILECVPWGRLSSDGVLFSFVSRRLP